MNIHIGLKITEEKHSPFGCHISEVNLTVGGLFG
jgi:hypothetical protein